MLECEDQVSEKTGSLKKKTESVVGGVLSDRGQITSERRPLGQWQDGSTGSKFFDFFTI